MKMKYCKIRNVDLLVCTAEQKIAYNLASRYYDLFIKKYLAASTAIGKDEIVRACIQMCMEDWKRKENKRYNEDAIFCALNAGMKSFFDCKSKILTTYEEIGKVFPANYL